MEKGTGVERVMVRPVSAEIGGAVAEFERLILDGKLQHNQSPILDWQIGHVEIVSKANGVKLPVKPGGQKDSIKKIDGAMATITALRLAMEPDPNRSWYIPGSLSN